MEKSGFFNSVNGDRKYQANFFAEYFSSFIGNGVFPNPSTGLQIIANDDMTITLSTGQAWINGYYYNNTDNLTLTLDNADGVLNRIDRIVLQYSTADRQIVAVVKQGTFASSPVAIELTRDADYYELGIADIEINAGAVSISQDNVTDLRLDTELCGVVHGVVEQVDTTTLFNQYQTWYTEKMTEYNTNMTQWTADKQTELQTNIDDMEVQFQNDWNTWFATVQGALDGDVAGNLLNLINTNTNKINNLTTELGDKTLLNTGDKSSLVGAVNEVNTDLDNLATNKDTATVDQVLQANGDGTSTFKTLDIPEPVDYGRYQADMSGFNDAELVYCELDNNNIILLDTHTSLNVLGNTNVQLNSEIRFGGGSGYRGQKILGVDLPVNMKSIESLEFCISNTVTGVPKGLTAQIYDVTTATIIAEASLTDSEISTQSDTFKKFMFNDAVIDLTHDYIFGLKADNDSDSSNHYNYYYNSYDNMVGYMVHSNSGWDDIIIVAGSDMSCKINYFTQEIKATQGTATKTISPENAQKWGNIKVECEDIEDGNNVEILNDKFLFNSFVTDTAEESIYNTVFRGALFTLFTTLEDTLSFEIKVKKYGSPNDLQVQIYDDNSGMPSSIIGSTIINSDLINTEYTIIREEIPLLKNIQVNANYYIILKNTATNVSDRYAWAINTLSQAGNQIDSTNNGVTWTTLSTTRQYVFNILSQLQLKSQPLTNGTNIIDLSDIDIYTYPSLKTKFNLSRNTTEDNSPILSNPSWTWEGESKSGAWEIIADVTLDSDVAQIDFENLGLEEYKYLKIFCNAQSTISSDGSINIYFNGILDVYSYVYLQDSNTTVGNDDASRGMMLGLLNENDYNRYGIGEVTITNIPNINQSYMYQAIGTLLGDTYTSAIPRIYRGGGGSSQTDQITKISLLGSNTIKQGSTFTLMGVK